MRVTADLSRRARVREAAGSAVQYTLLFGFAAVAAAISAHGLVGFARANMGLPGPWPYLLWGALDGAAGLCAVLLGRRAARGESAVAPRLAVWGLGAASSLFNWTHAPHHPGARAAFALMPVIAAVLFEFSLRETRHTAQHAERRMPGLGWLRPAERIRVQLRLASDASLSAEEATRQVRIEFAARHLNTLRLALSAQDKAATSRGTARRVARAERRARAALTRTRFADPAIAADVLRHVQVLTLTPALARLDYTAPDDAQTLLASLITAMPASNGPVSPGPLDNPRSPAGIPASGGSPPQVNGTAPPMPLPTNGDSCRALPLVTPLPLPLSRNGRQPTCSDHDLVVAAAHIIGEAREGGTGLSQAALARRLRAQGFHIANERLRWLAAASGLERDQELE